MTGRNARGRHADGVSGVNPGAATAVFGFIGICVLVAGGVVAGSLLRGAAPQPSGPRVVVSESTAPLSQIPGVDQADRPIAISALAGPEDIINARVADVMNTASTRIAELQEVFREASELASVAAQSPGGTVIVVTDVLPPMTRSARSAIESVSARMMAFGFSVVGNLPGIDVEGEELDRQVELIARLRSARAQVPLGSDDAARIFKQFLAANAEAGDAIVWIAPGEDRDEPTFYFAVREEPEGPTIRTQRIRQTLKTALELGEGGNP